jgi:hypothetical protein
MVLFSSFGNIDAPTPHGGPAFHGWKNGFGFGKAAGPGCHVLAPNMPMQLRSTPSDDRCFAATPFWRKKWEVGQAAAFGFGDRPTYGKSEKDGSVAPNNYGDISKQVMNTRNNVVRAGITLAPKFPSMEEKYRDLSWPKSGPGPGKYDTRIPAGQGSWFNSTPNPSFSMQSRPILDGALREGMGKPGAGDYETRIDPGKNAPHLHGTLYNITCRGRLEHNDAEGGISPGPSRYNHKDGFDSKGLLEKILNVPIPPRQHRRTSMPLPEGMEQDEEAEGEGYDGRTTQERGRQGSTHGKPRGGKHGSSTGTRRKLPRVESSPAELGRASH